MRAGEGSQTVGIVSILAPEILPVVLQVSWQGMVGISSSGRAKAGPESVERAKQGLQQMRHSESAPAETATGLEGKTEDFEETCGK